MKRMILLLFTSFALFGSSQAQILGGIFSQKSSDLQSLTKQIALLQLYIGWVEKGNKIAQEGLTTIGEIKNGELNLHSLFLSSLSSVNPEIKEYSKVGIIISDEIFVAQNLKKVLAINHLTRPEIDYVKTIYSNIIDACGNSLNELIDVISDNQYQMKDDERIRKIDGIYSDMEGKVSLTKGFYRDVSMLSEQRAVEANDIDFLKNVE